MDTGSGQEAAATENGASRQQSELLRWLLANPPPPRESAIRIRARLEKVRTLRQALAAEGLHILPDPLKGIPVHKVARVRDLLDSEFDD